MVIARLAVRAAAGAVILAFFAWLWAEGAIRVGSLGWISWAPLVVLGYLAYAFLAHAGEAALDGRELGLRSEAATESQL
jgi:hypothetical protein